MICHSRPFSINSMPRDGVSWSLYTGGPLRLGKYMASYVLTAQALPKGPIEWDLTQTLHTSRSAPSMRRALERHFQQNHYLWRSILSAADQVWALSPRCIFAVPFRYILTFINHLEYVCDVFGKHTNQTGLKPHVIWWTALKSYFWVLICTQHTQKHNSFRELPLLRLHDYWVWTL